MQEICIYLYKGQIVNFFFLPWNLVKFVLITVFTLRTAWVPFLQYVNASLKIYATLEK